MIVLASSHQTKNDCFAVWANNYEFDAFFLCVFEVTVSFNASVMRLTTANPKL
jgi:hypothetical protein